MEEEELKPIIQRPQMGKNIFYSTKFKRIFKNTNDFQLKVIERT